MLVQIRINHQTCLHLDYVFLSGVHHRRENGAISECIFLHEDMLYQKGHGAKVRDVQNNLECCSSEKHRSPWQPPPDNTNRPRFLLQANKGRKRRERFPK